MLVLLALDATQALEGTPAGDAFGRWFLWVVFALGGVAFAVRAVQVPAERLPWSLMAAAWSTYVAGGLWLNLVQDGGGAFPQVSDVLYLGWYPLAIACFAVLLHVRGVVRSRAMWLDGAIGALTVTAIGAMLFFATTLRGGDAVAGVYALADLTVLGFVAVVGAVEGWRLDRTWACVVLGMIGITVGDSAYLVQATTGGWSSGQVLDVPYVLGTLLLCAAAWQPHREPAALDPSSTRLFTLPLGFAAVAVALQAVDLAWDLPTIPHVLVSATLALVVVRLGVTFRDYAGALAGSRREALTDAVTGLGNRRALVADLDAALADGAPRVLAIFDLDGFKFYNDSFGHAAGDALLTRLGRALGAATAGRASAYRLGGDEFCVLLPGTARAAAPAVQAAVAALTEDGEGFRIDNSHGVVALPTEAADPTTALKLADQRMYARKNARPTSALSQTRELLVGVLAEREPDLHEHVLDVGRLAGETARRLGLDEQEAAHVVTGAELHDVGKIAIPDAILHKPGPLDADEWAFMKRHTLIGERFLAGVPALKDAARYVR
ncbi:MAG: diguanylate cyclase, partial [Solirubrobacterales bacterium]|nr:diguanylate cyclase [Solirubrobacterales bacterium]